VVAFFPDATPYDSLGAVGSFLKYLAYNYPLVLKLGWVKPLSCKGLITSTHFIVITVFNQVRCSRTYPCWRGSVCQDVMQVIACSSHIWYRYTRTTWSNIY